MSDNDLISRKAAIEAIKPLLYCGNFVSTLINLPAVDAAPVKHGHWIYKRHGWAECSECHHDYHDVYDLENSDNYCRYCGALMDGKGETMR